MNSTALKILVFALIFLDEGLSIYAEMIGARNAHANSQPLLEILLKMFLIIAIAGGFLIIGYALGFKSFKNIWIVSVISITSILIVEPLLAWSIFKQAPTTGALVGLVLGATGLVVSML